MHLPLVHHVLPHTASRLVSLPGNSGDATDMVSAGLRV